VCVLEKKKKEIRTFGSTSSSFFSSYLPREEVVALKEKKLKLPPKRPAVHKIFHLFPISGTRTAISLVDDLPFNQFIPSAGMHPRCSFISFSLAFPACLINWTAIYLIIISPYPFLFCFVFFLLEFFRILLTCSLNVSPQHRRVQQGFFTSISRH
jgi:hypothetical protein